MRDQEAVDARELPHLSEMLTSVVVGVKIPFRLLIISSVTQDIGRGPFGVNETCTP